MKRLLATRPLRSVGSLVGTVLVPLLLLLFIYRLLRHFDTNWDVLAYHMPFSAKRVGIPDADSVVLSSVLRERYAGFPPFADYVRGFLWKMTGKVEAGNLLTSIAMISVIIYTKLYYRISAKWTLLIFIAIPALHTALAAQLVDLWANSFFSIFLLAAYHSVYRSDRRLGHTLVAVIALSIAVNSKSHFFIIGAIGLLCFIITLVHANLTDRSNTGRRRFAYRLSLVIALSPVIFLSPLVNSWKFHNPVYPVAVSVAGLRLQGPEPLWEGSGPADLRSLPKWALFALSELEYRALSMRAGGYSSGQGDVPSGSEADGMGGSLVVLFATAIAALLAALSRFDWRQSGVLIPLGSMVVLVIAVAAFPASYNLRYFTFIEIIPVVAALASLSVLKERGDTGAAGILFGLRSTLLGSAIFISFITGFSHIYPAKLSSQELVRALGVKTELRAALLHSDRICYARLTQLGVLYTTLFNRDLEKHYTVIGARSPSECPADFYVLE